LAGYENPAAHAPSYMVRRAAEWFRSAHATSGCERYKSSGRVSADCLDGPLPGLFLSNRDVLGAVRYEQIRN
jgi:hypothetical protein